jgi:hypothetical protein
MEWVRRFLKSGLGGDPRDSVRALESIRGSRMEKQEANTWVDVIQGTRKEVGGPC